MTEALHTVRPLRLSVLGAALGAALICVPLAAAADTYQNDGFVDGSTVGFQAGFVSGEMGAACFTPPEGEYPIRLTAAQLIFGGERDDSTVVANMKVFSRGGAGNEPSNLVADIEDIEFISSTSAFNEVDLTSYGIVVREPWCIAVQMQQGGLPAIARDDDGTIDAGNNWLYAVDPFSGSPVGWFQSATLGLIGDWIIRAIGTPSGGGGPGPADTGTDDTGDTGAPDVGVDARADAGLDTAPDTPAAGVRIDEVDQSSEDPSEEIEVTITGSGFESSFRYRVGPRTLSDVNVIDAREASGILEADALDPGVYDVSVRGDFGEQVFSNAIVLREVDVSLPAPTAISVTPDETQLGSSTNIVIIGDNFVQGASVTLDRRALPGVTVTNPQTIQGFVPGDHVDAAGEVELVVRNPDGQAAATLVFEFTAPPPETSSGCATTGTAAGSSRSGACLGMLAALVFMRRRR